VRSRVCSRVFPCVPFPFPHPGMMEEFEFRDEEGDVMSPMDWSVDQVRQWASQFVSTETAATIRANGAQLCCLLPTSSCVGCEGIPAAAVEALKQCPEADAYRSSVVETQPVSGHYYATVVKRWDSLLLRCWAVLVAGCSEAEAEAVVLAATPYHLGVLAGFEPESPLPSMPPMPELPECVRSTAATRQFRLRPKFVAGWGEDSVRFWARHVLRLDEDDVAKLACWPQVVGLPWTAFVGADVGQLAQLRLSVHALRILGNVLCLGLLDMSRF
jgi:hypothetical protein